MKTPRKTHHEMIREAVTNLKEARPRAIIEYIRKKNPRIHINESSFRSDIIGCSVNHPSSRHYPGMPKFLFFEEQRKTYRLYDPKRDGKLLTLETPKPLLKSSLAEVNEVGEREVRIGREILRAFNRGVGIFRDLHSESANDIGLDNDLYLNYITFTSAIDYQKNIEANVLWKAAKEWARRYPWLFEPKELMNRPLAQVITAFKGIRERESGIFRPQDVGIWLLIAEALYVHDGKTSKLLENYDFDAWRIYNEFSGRLKKEFPFLSGPKILPMWLKILQEDANVPLKNMGKLPLPVDKNVAEVSYNLIFKKKFDGNVSAKTRELVRAVWKHIADKLNVPVINFDTPLWTLGGNKGCSNSLKARCVDCPVKSYCFSYSQR